MNRIKSFIKRESTTVLVGVFFSIIAFLLLALVRHFDSSTFSFIQIILVTILLAGIIYVSSFFAKHKIFGVLHNRELAVILIVFTILSFSILNIDRSRSFYLTKWVQISGEHGTTVDEIISKYNFSTQDANDLLQRVNEQKQSGTIFESDGRLKLTAVGMFIVGVSTFIASFENLNGYPKK